MLELAGAGLAAVGAFVVVFSTDEDWLPYGFAIIAIGAGMLIVDRLIDSRRRQRRIR